MGRIHDPIFRIVAIDSRRGRDSAELANLGVYDPKRGYFRMNVILFEEWIAKGAQPTKSLMSLIKAQPRLNHL